MGIKKIRELTTLELKEKLKTEIRLYEQRRISHRISPIKNSAVITESRREISRIKTEMRYREINHK